MSIAAELEKLQSLYDKGVLSAEEFTKAKAKVLGESNGFNSIQDSSRSMLQQLRRSNSDRVFGGVCGGLGQYTDMPAWAWRVLFCLTVFGFGFGLLLYILLWLFVPAES